MSISYKSVKQFQLDLPYRNGNSFPDQMAKKNYICKWIYFAISTFAIIEEMASVLAHTSKMNLISPGRGRHSITSLQKCHWL
jgi:hypothetical protein